MLSKLYQALTSLQGIPSAYGFFRDPQTPPFIVFQTAYSRNFTADDLVYHKRDRYSVILYTGKKDPATETTVESALDKAGFIYDKTETFLDEEELYQIIYTIYER